MRVHNSLSTSNGTIIQIKPLFLPWVKMTPHDIYACVKARGYPRVTQTYQVWLLLMESHLKNEVKEYIFVNHYNNLKLVELLFAKSLIFVGNSSINFPWFSTGFQERCKGKFQIDTRISQRNSEFADYSISMRIFKENYNI